MCRATGRGGGHLPCQSIHLEQRRPASSFTAMPFPQTSMVCAFPPARVLLEYRISLWRVYWVQHLTRLLATVFPVPCRVSHPHGASGKSTPTTNLGGVTTDP